MILSDIVRYLNQLDTLIEEFSASRAVSDLTKINFIVENSKLQIPEISDALASNFIDVKTILNFYEENLNKLRASVLDLIRQQESKYFSISQELYQGMINESPDYILQRTTSVDQDTLRLLQARLQLHNNWQYPGMIIRPAKSPGVVTLVALDPMYFVDTHLDLIDHATSKFTPEYQKRIRKYRIKEYLGLPLFQHLPKNQFGFVYSFFYFEFKPWEILQQYLLEVFDLLRDGGTFLFSFNDCDYPEAVGAVEHNFCCYTPGRLVRSYAVSVGYEIVQSHRGNNSIHWLELQRPGTSQSIRGGQALAMIFKKPKPVIEIKPEVIDKSNDELYNSLNSLNLGELINLARMLSVDISDDKTKGMFNIKKVRQTVTQYLEQQNWPEEKLRKLFKRT
jgi:SAM-dependent methyltransferase